MGSGGNVGAFFVAGGGLILRSASATRADFWNMWDRKTPFQVWIYVARAQRLRWL